MGGLPWAQMELPQQGWGGNNGGWPGRESEAASHHWYRKELRSVKSSRGSWDSSVTQLLKLKVSAGPVWLVLQVTTVLLGPASRPWKYCQGSGRGGQGHPTAHPQEPPGLPAAGPVSGRFGSCLWGLSLSVLVLFPEPGTAGAL